MGVRRRGQATAELRCRTGLPRFRYAGLGRTCPMSSHSRANLTARGSAARGTAFPRGTQPTHTTTPSTRHGPVEPNRTKRTVRDSAWRDGRVSCNRLFGFPSVFRSPDLVSGCEGPVVIFSNAQRMGLEFRIRFIEADVQCDGRAVETQEGEGTGVPGRAGGGRWWSRRPAPCQRRQRATGREGLLSVGGTPVRARLYGEETTRRCTAG